MVDQVRLLCARRAYEFRLDDIKLTALSVPEVRERIQTYFTFHVSDVNTPMDTFGPVPKTLPPGVIFDWGRIAFPEGILTPIRFIHFEQKRVVIDIAGASSTIDVIFARLRELLAATRLPDGLPPIGEPIRQLDYSEISAHCAFSPAALLPPQTVPVFERMLSAGEPGSARVVAPTLRVRALHDSEEYPGTPTKFIPGAFTLDLRGGTSPADRVYFSTATLDTDAHLAYLGELEQALTQPAG